MDDMSAEPWYSVVSTQNPELLKKAQEELNENPDQRDKDIQKFKEMILENQKLTSPLDDVFLLRFLRARKFNHDRAFKLLQRYFSVRYADLFTDFRPSADLAALNENIHAILPNRDQVGRKIYVIKLGGWDPKISTFDKHIRFFHMCVETTLLEEETHVHGVVVVFDMTHLALKHALHITPAHAKRCASAIQECLPARFKGFHAVFEPPIFDVVYQIFKPFLNKKTRSRVFLHGNNLAALHRHIHPDYLPEEFGGVLPPTDYSLTTQYLLSRDDEIANAATNYGFLG